MVIEETDKQLPKRQVSSYYSYISYTIAVQHISNSLPSQTAIVQLNPSRQAKLRQQKCSQPMYSFYPRPTLP